MTPTENLINEHKDIIELLGIMTKIAEKIKLNNIFYTSDVEDIIGFMTLFIEKNHHKKEEIFYPALSVSEITENNELSLMLYEHVLAKNYLRDINSCIENCKIGNTFSGELLAESIVKYVVLIKTHLQKEENIIFPLANEIMGEEKQKEIYKQFEKIEEKIFTHGSHEHFHQLLLNLKVKYPN